MLKPITGREGGLASPCRVIRYIRVKTHTLGWEWSQPPLTRDAVDLLRTLRPPLGKKEVCSWYDCSYCRKWVPRFGCLPSLKLFSPRVTEQSQHSWLGPAFFSVDSQGGQHLRPLVPPSRQEKRVWRSQRTVSELDHLEVNAYNFCSTLWQEKPYGTTWQGWELSS